MMKSIRFALASLAVAICAALAVPAFATDLPVDGNLRFGCSVAGATTSASGNGTAATATINGKCGIIVSEALTNPTASEYTLTLTNSAIAISDVVLAMVGNGTNTTGTPAIGRVTPAAGSVAIVVRQPNGTAFNGTVQIRFLVLK